VNSQEFAHVLSTPYAAMLEEMWHAVESATPEVLA
jgi:hypothetical protein